MKSHQRFTSHVLRSWVMSECDICKVSLLRRIYRRITGRHPKNPTYCEECYQEIIQDLFEQIMENVDCGSRQGGR